MHASTVGAVQPETQPETSGPAIDSFDAGHLQREIRLLAERYPPKWVDEDTVRSWQSKREAVVWCWANQRLYVGVKEKPRQAMFANLAGLHPPHASRCLKADSAAPMELPDRCVNALAAFTGWLGVRQYQLLDSNLTALEQVLEQRRTV